jgi:hypothetical protein
MATYKDQVLGECWRIANLARALAEAAEREFMAPIDDPDFESDESAADYAGGMRVLRRRLERIVMLTEGADPMLDEAIYTYRVRVLLECNPPASIN